MAFDRRGRKVASVLLFLLPALLASVSPSSAADSARPAERGRTTVVPFPFLFYSDETRLGGGASLSYVRREAGASEAALPTNYGLLLLYTERDQYSAVLGVDRTFGVGRWVLSSSLAFAEFPADFFGFGNGTDADSSEVYTPRGTAFDLSLERRVGGRWQTGPVVQWSTQDVVERRSGGRLQTTRPTGWDGGTVFLFGWSATWEGRSQVYYPESGGWIRLQSSFAAAELGSDFDFSRHSVDLRWYRLLDATAWGRPILALRAHGVHAGGNVPFDRMPTLGGGGLLRGFFGGRFRESTLASLQAELRVGHWKRLGAVVFAGTGTVADGPGSLSLGSLHAVGGLGLRLQLSQAEKLHVRADFGINDEGGSGFYLNFQEAF